MRLFAEAFPGEALAASAAGGGSTAPGARVAVALEVGAATARLLEADRKLHDDVTYKVAAVKALDGKVAAETGREATLVLKPVTTAAGPPPADVAYQIQTALDLPPGSYQLRASASSTKLGAGGSVYLTIDVPDFSRSSLAISGLVVGYADGERVPVAPPVSEPTADGRPGAPVPLPLPFPPTLDRLFRRTDVVRVYCQVRRASASDLLHVDVELIDGENHAVRSSAYDFGSAPGGSPVVDVDHRLDLSAVPPGAYHLRVSATHGGSVARQEIGLAVR